MLPYLSFNFLTNLSSFCFRNTLTMVLLRLPCFTEPSGHSPFLTSPPCIVASMFLHLSSLSFLDTPPPDSLSTSSLLNAGSFSSVSLSSVCSPQDSVPGPCFWCVSGWMSQTSTTLPGNYYHLQSQVQNVTCPSAYFFWCVLQVTRKENEWFFLLNFFLTSFLDYQGAVPHPVS